MSTTVDFTATQNELAEAARQGFIGLELLNRVVESAQPNGTEQLILHDDQLLAAMLLVAETAPNLLFAAKDCSERCSVSEKLRLRLGDERVAALLEFAAGKLQNLNLVSLDVLATLPLCVQLGLARRLTPSGMWVIQMALQMDVVNGLRLLKELGRTFDTDSVATYTWWRNRHAEDDPRLSKEIEYLLRQALKDQDFLVGVLKAETYRGRKRLYTQGIDRCKYVQDRHQGCYTLRGGGTAVARVGDVVLFRRRSGYPLVPGKLHATHFMLVCRATSSK